MTIEQLYHDYQRMVYNLALQYVQHAADAEEITQDVFVAVAESLQTFQHKAKPSTWIYRITINKAIDFLKARKRKKRFAVFTALFGDNGHEVQHHASNFDHPGVLLEQKEALARLFGHINTLPDKQKTALILMKIDGLSQAETAEIMEISSKAVESLVQRAKVNLAKKITPGEGNTKQ